MQQIQELFIFLSFFGLIGCDLYKPFFFKEEEVRHVRDASAQKGTCDDDVFLEFLAGAQITNPESIVGIAITDFEATCSSTSAIIKKVDKYLKNCTASPSLYINLLNGLRTFDEKLCRNNAFYKKYDNYDKCISDLDNDYDSCDGVADWNENEDRDKVCKTYKKIVDCYYIKTAKVCGIKAALTLKELMVEVIDCTLTVKCSVGASPTVKDAMSDKYVDSLNNEGPSANENIYIQNIIRSFLVLLLYFV